MEISKLKAITNKEQLQKKLNNIRERKFNIIKNYAKNINDKLEYISLEHQEQEILDRLKEYYYEI